MPHLRASMYFDTFLDESAHCTQGILVMCICDECFHQESRNAYTAVPTVRQLQVAFGLLKPFRRSTPSKSGVFRHLMQRAMAAVGFIIEGNLSNCQESK